MELLKYLLVVIGQIVAGVIAWQTVTPESFLGFCGFAILWQIIAYVVTFVLTATFAFLED